jgi:hypothetical protein
MRELTKKDKPALLEVIRHFEKVFEFPCDHLTAYIWLQNYKLVEILNCLEITVDWRDRKTAKNEVVTSNDVERYATSVMRNRTKARSAVAEILGEGDGQ